MSISRSYRHTLIWLLGYSQTHLLTSLSVIPYHSDTCEGSISGLCGSGGVMPTLPSCLLPSPSSGSLSPPPVRRGWCAAVAGLPVAAGMSLGRTCRHSVPGILGPEEEGTAGGQLVPTLTFIKRLCLVYPALLPPPLVLCPESPNSLG